MTAHVSTNPEDRSATSSRSPARALLYLVLIAFAIYYLLPLFIMVVNSVKPLAEIQGGNMPSATARRSFPLAGTACCRPGSPPRA